MKPGDGVNPPPATPYQGLDHFGLAVSGIDAIAAELKQKGVEFSKAPHVPRPGIKICFLRGPQGISIELLDRDPKYLRARGLRRRTIDCLGQAGAPGCIGRPDPP